jgi:sulfhydrogenase subunit alpha
LATLDAPSFERDSRLVALWNPGEYPMNVGRIVSNDGLNIAASEWRQAFGEQQVAWSNALQARGRDGRPYLLGPAARITLAGGQLHPVAASALARTGLAREIQRNPYWSIAARAIELVHACAEALDIIEAYQPPDQPAVAWRPRRATAAWATEAPRGLIFHAYDLDERGLVRHAQIVPPTSQNQAAIEADLTAFAPRVLDLPRAEATLRIEQLIRSYDPCISCATHFLDLRVEDVS